MLKQTVRRNIRRFPDDFMFELSEDEINFMVSQNVIPSRKQLGGASPFAFTEQGVAMLSGLLNSENAIQVNISIMRAFVQVGKLISGQKEVIRKLNELEDRYDEQFRLVFAAIRELIRQENQPMTRIGFKQYDDP